MRRTNENTVAILGKFEKVRIVKVTEENVVISLTSNIREEETLLKLNNASLKLIHDFVEDNRAVNTSQVNELLVETKIKHKCFSREMTEKEPTYKYVKCSGIIKLVTIASQFVFAVIDDRNNTIHSFTFEYCDSMDSIEKLIRIFKQKMANAIMDINNW